MLKSRSSSSRHYNNKWSEMHACNKQARFDPGYSDTRTWLPYWHKNDTKGDFRYQDHSKHLTRKGPDTPQIKKETTHQDREWNQIVCLQMVVSRPIHRPPPKRDNRIYTGSSGSSESLTWSPLLLNSTFLIWRSQASRARAGVEYPLLLCMSQRHVWGRERVCLEVERGYIQAGLQVPSDHIAVQCSYHCRPAWPAVDDSALSC
jgi:hypothetical protein